MKRSQFRNVLGASVIALVGGVFLLSNLRRGIAQVPEASDTDPHMAMTKLHSADPGDKTRADDILAAAKKAAERYVDYRKAEADGYRIFMPDQRQSVYHFVIERGDEGAKTRFDPENPPALLYTRTGGANAGANSGYKLVGVMYMAPYNATEDELNARIPLSVAQWHLHLNVCAPPQPGQRTWLMEDPIFGVNGSITSAEACRAVGGLFLPHLSGWMTHVYVFETDPAKIWAAGMDDHHGMSDGSMPGMKM